MSRRIGVRSRKKVNMLLTYDSKRWHRWWNEGRKDGLAGVIGKNPRSIPKLYRHAYRAGMHWGTMCREAGHDMDCDLEVTA